MITSLTRSQLLSRGARVGTALLIGGSAAGTLAVPADGAPPAAALGSVGAADLAYARLLVGVELLLIDFYTNAIAAGHLSAGALADARVALINETEHYAFLAYAIRSAGLTPLTAADVDFSYPAASYYSASSVEQLAVTLETVALGAYLGSAGVVANPVLASAIAQITANEAEHVGAWSARTARPAFHDAFTAALTIAEASDALDAYAS